MSILKKHIGSKLSVKVIDGDNIQIYFGVLISEDDDFIELEFLRKDRNGNKITKLIGKGMIKEVNGFVEDKDDYYERKRRR